MKSIEDYLKSFIQVEIAKSLLQGKLKGKSVEDLWKIEEDEKLKRLCFYEDPALIIALCIRLKEREKELNKLN
jgi:hypothetical protein